MLGGARARVRTYARRLATAIRNGRSFTMTWPGASLPPPAVSGNVAACADVLPGVDLAPHATDLGFTHVLIVRTAAAAADPWLRELMVDLGGDARVTQRSDGSLTAVAGDVLVASAPAPQMWDSRPALS